MKRHLPNAITSANLLCGCLAIQAAILGELPKSAFFVLLAAFLDFFDGMAARLLKVSSPIFFLALEWRLRSWPFI